METVIKRLTIHRDYQLQRADDFSRKILEFEAKLEEMRNNLNHAIQEVEETQKAIYLLTDATMHEDEAKRLTG